MIHSVVMFSFLTLLTVFFMQLVRSMIERPIVETNYGSVRGIFMRSRENRTFFGFLGIPYAMPPVNESRFLPPQTPQSWEGIRDASEEGAPCPQPNFFFLHFTDKFVGVEDCLTLNVYTPDITKPNLPVMVYIHGGGWMTGSGSYRLQGPEYFMDKNIVLVAINYRLGVLGFLSTEDHVLPGNNGLKDQVMALKWVKDNIASFGGNSSLVTLFGNSAGASSVHLHMQSPLSQGLFLRGISQSGTAMSAFSVIGTGSSLNITLHIADRVNCSRQSTEEVVECLRSVPDRDLLEAQDSILNSRFDNNVLARPVVEPPNTENAFLTSSPFKAVTKADWMTGVNKEEGAYKYALLNLEGSTKFSQFETKNFEQFGPQTLLIDDTTTNALDITKKIHQFYFGNGTFSVNTSAPQIINLYTDAWIMHSSLRAANQHNGTLYFYLYDYRGNITFPNYFGITEDYGVSHCDELIYLFTMKNVFPGQLNEKDTLMSKLMIDFWTNFATYGNPTPVPINKNPTNRNNGTMDFTWEKMIPKENSKYCHIQGNRLHMEENLFADRTRFWNSLPIYDKCHDYY